MNKRRFVLGLFCILFFSFCSCKLNAEEFAQYMIEAKFVNNKESSEYKIGGLECNFYNLFNKPVSKFILVFSLFDGDGLPVLLQVQYEIIGEVGYKEYTSFKLNLDEQLKNEQSEIKNVDFIYASKIYFKDGSIWSDPFGLKYFAK